MNVIVVLEFRKWKEFVPVVLSLVDEYTKVLFQLLIDLLRLSIALRMISSGSCKLDSEKAIQLPSKFRHKLWTSIRQHFSSQAMMLPDMLDIQPSGTGGGNGGIGVHKVRSLCDGIPNHHNTIL